MKKTFVFFISICFLQCGMDYNVVSNITNNSGDTVMVTVVFDKPYFDSVFKQNRKQVLLSINNINETSGLPYSFDNVHLRTTYLVPNDTSLRVSETKGGYGVRPSHNSVYKIMIYKKDLTPIGSIENIDAAFKKKSNTEWQYIIH
jgi:hypothetical protein